MGKVRIVSGGEDGNYQVQRVYNDWSLQIRKNLLQAEIDRLTAENTELDAKIAELQPKYNQAIEEYNTALVQFIADLRAAADAGEDYPSNDYGHAEKYGEAQQLQWQILEAQRTKALNELALTKDQETLASLEALQDPPAEQAWCADFTEDATGELASIEVPGEPQKLLVYPQARQEGAHNPARDGLLMPRLWATPEQAYWCAAVLPGWQRFKPTYRTGVITEIDYDADTCTVDIDGTFSSAQDLYINLDTGGGLPEYGNTPTDVILEGVPIEYMTCNSVAFEIGDKVVVQFDNQWYWDQGKVIGFSSDPKNCLAFDLKLATQSLKCYQINTGIFRIVCWENVGPTSTTYGYATQRDDYIQASVVRSVVIKNAKGREINKVTIGVEVDHHTYLEPDCPDGRTRWSWIYMTNIEIKFSNSLGDLVTERFDSKSVVGWASLEMDYAEAYLINIVNSVGINNKGETYINYVRKTLSNNRFVLPGSGLGVYERIEESRQMLYTRDGEWTDSLISEARIELAQEYPYYSSLNVTTTVPPDSTETTTTVSSISAILGERTNFSTLTVDGKIIATSPVWESADPAQ